MDLPFQLGRGRGSAGGAAAKPARLWDYWTGQDLGTHTNEFRIPGLPPRTPRVILAEPIQSRNHEP